MNKPAALGLLLIIALALGLRVYDLSRAPLWLDEFAAMESSAGRGLAHMFAPNGVPIEHPISYTKMDPGAGLGDVWRNLDTDTHPPLYFLLLHVWRRMFGDSPGAIRMLSALLSIAAIPLLFDAARITVGRGPALWACGLMAVSNQLIYHAQEARNYPLLVLFACGTLAALARLKAHGYAVGRIVALGVCVFGMMLTHYYALGAALATGLYVLIAMRGRTRWSAVASLLIVAVVYLLTWGPQMPAQMRVANAADTRLWSLSSEWELPLYAASSLFCQIGDVPLEVHWLPQASIVLAGIVLVVPVLMFRRRGLGPLSLWWTWAVCTIGVVYLSDYLRHTALIVIPRYLTPAAPAVFVILAAALPARLGIWRYTLPLVAGVISLLYLTNVYHDPRDNWRTIAGYVDSQAGRDDAIVFYGHQYPWRARASYLSLGYYMNPWPCPVLVDDQPLAEATQQWLRQRHSVWVLVGAEDGREAPALIPGAVPVGGARIPGEIWVWKYVTR